MDFINKLSAGVWTACSCTSMIYLAASCKNQKKAAEFRLSSWNWIEGAIAISFTQLILGGLMHVTSDHGSEKREKALRTIKLGFISGCAGLILKCSIVAQDWMSQPPALPTGSCALLSKKQLACAGRGVIKFF